MPFDLTTSTPITVNDAPESIDQGGVATLIPESGVKNNSFDLSTAAPVNANSDGTTEFDEFQKLSPEATQLFNGPTPSAFKVYSEVGMRGIEMFVTGATKIVSKFGGVEGQITHAVVKALFEQGKLPEEELARGVKKHPMAATTGAVVGGISPFLAVAPLFPSSLLGLSSLFATVGGVTKIGEFEMLAEEVEFNVRSNFCRIC